MKREFTYPLVRMLFILTLFCLFFLQPALVLRALDPDKSITQYSLYIWNMEGGLPANSVYAVLQTRDGYIWIGTPDGLVRFDGIHFEVYNKKKIPQLESNFIHALYEDRNGTLWIGTSDGGLTRYKDGRFTTYPITKYRVLYKISAINEDRWGNLWIGSLTEGLTCLSNKKFTTYTSKDGLPGNSVRFINKDGNGDLWVVTAPGVVKLVKPGDFRIYVSHRDFPYFKTACLYEEDHGDLWLGTGDGGLFRLRNGKLFVYGAEKGVTHPTINYIYKDRSKNLWIGTDGGGLARMKNGVFHTLSKDEGLASGYVYSIYEDREGSLWIGTVDGGLHQLKDSKFTSYTTREGLAHNYIQCIHKGQGNHLWIGTNGGLSVFDLEKGKLTTYMTITEGLLDNPVTCIWEDSEGYLWIGTLKGLHRYRDGEFIYLTKKDGLTDSRINCIFKNKQGNIWIGTENGLNLLKGVDNRGSTIKIFTRDKGLLSNVIEDIYEDSRGNLWIGTDAGLNRFGSGVITKIDLGSRLENSPIKCIYEDNEGVLWFGTHNGLARLKQKKTGLDVDTYTYTTQSGLIEDYVFSILEDGNGYLWLAGQNGISRIRKKEFEEFSAGKIHGLHPDWFNEMDGMKARWCTSAACKTPDGRFWFPTGVGVAMIHPDRIETDTQPPPIIIEKFVVDGESINMKEKENPKKPLVLSPGKKRLEFYYTSLSFINPQKIKFKLQLEPYDTDWIRMGATRSTTYTGLLPGHYTFKVTACNPDGNWNQKGVAFSFYLKPYFHETVWFYLLIALFILMAAVSFYLFRVRQLKARERELARLVELRTRDLKERTVELEKAHHKLRQSKEIIEEKNRHITDSMRYAHKIQQVMLPIKEKMAKELQEYFVIYKPKDIVSGDFYWFDAIDDQYFLAVADCTGHGVPGALLSMIGCMKLNEVVNERGIREPALALSHLHQGFRRVLKQERGDLETHTYDGMDVGLCRIDLSAGKITFAGARHRLFYIKNSELVEIKGNRKSIGGRQKEEKRFFTNHEIDIENEIMIYLTSDGFADQHDPLNQKYGSRRLKEFLKSHAHFNAHRQEEVLLKELARHQAYEEQRDDITVLGIRLRI